MAGWGMGTLWARAGNPKLMTWRTWRSLQFRKVIVDYFRQAGEHRRDGVHVDKMFPTGLDYNPDSPMSPDTSTWEGAIQLTQEIVSECRKMNPDGACPSSATGSYAPVRRRNLVVRQPAHHAQSVSRKCRDARAVPGLRLPEDQRRGS